MAIRWMESHVPENNRQEAPTKEQLEELDCLKDLDHFKTTCKIWKTPPPCCKQRVEEQRCWRSASNIDRMATDVLQDTETESAYSMSEEEDMEQ